MGKLTVTNFQEKQDFAKREHEVLEFWDETKAFEKSVSERPEDKRYVFYDGPPFATGLPHYGHILTSVIKDAVPRYWTMKGYRVDRVWGWDCHGIPIENMIEKELGLKGGKKGIEEMGIDKFNAACRAAILRFDKEWEKVVKRIGRWVDFKNSYKTMDKTFMESVWWAFSELHKKGHIYEGKKIILYCPRCATPLSNFEIAMDNSYKDVEDNSVFVMFKVKDTTNEYFVAWTTTPWTLIGNVALAVSADADYVKVAAGDVKLWLAEKRAAAVLKEQDWEVKVEQKAKGKDLVGKQYEPLYDYMPLDGKKAHYVADADFVSLDDGTGIVHTAAIYGEDDYKLAVEKDLPRVPTMDDQGRFMDFVTPLSGIFYKKAEDWIVKDLESRDLMYRAEKYVHSYPFCYRCETPLYYNAVPAWFIDVKKIKPDLLTQNENIHWYPEYLKHGRFGNGLETAPDWNISRSRYWGTPMPIWQTEDKKQLRIVGSIDELKKWAVDPSKVENLTDIHREFLDDVEVWVDEAKTIKGKRIPEVFDCWVESGSMPYASLHYPFEHKELFDKTHPAQFIVEYISQTRAWFYTLHVMSVGLFGTHTFENALTHGVILAEDGTKMSKSKKNYPDPTLLFEKYGVDALRFYLMGGVVMKAENLNFSENDVKQVYQNLINIVWNVFAFYKLYGKSATPTSSVKPVHVLDQWIVSKTNGLIADVTTAMDSYDTINACRRIGEFVTDLSTWYLRRSRDRIREDKTTNEVFGWVLSQLMLVMAPITPFIAELMYQNIASDGSSIHLQSWPTHDAKAILVPLEEDMVTVRKIVEAIHSLRKSAGISVRQPLSAWAAVSKEGVLLKGKDDLLAVIAQEVNVLSAVDDPKALVDFSKATTVTNVGLVDKRFGQVTVYLDTHITEELKQQGLAREFTRAIQMMRKEKGCRMDERIRVQAPDVYKTLPKELLDQVQRETLVDGLTWGDTLLLTSTG